MKPIILTAFTFLLLTNCKKDIDNSNCKLEQKSYGPLGNSYKYEYDAMNRINTITFTHYSGVIFITGFTYYPDSIVASSGLERQTYFLNNNGLADSSIKTFPLGIPEQLKFYYKYTYNSEGQLINEREIFSQFNNGNTILDTNVHTYTVTGGNLVRVTNTKSSDDITYEYSTELRPANNFELMRETDKFPFIGKSSKNLVRKIFFNGVLNDEVSYEKDKKGNITRQTQRNPTNGQTTIIEYLYSCN